jgi:hypothetical protein
VWWGSHDWFMDLYIDTLYEKKAVLLKKRTVACLTFKYDQEVMHEFTAHGLSLGWLRDGHDR